MPVQLLDLILIGIMLISGLLALARGFTREVLSLVAWGLAAAAAWFAMQQKVLVDMATPMLGKEDLAKIAVAGVAFILTLIIVSVISVRLSDRVVDSGAGAFDRTVGLLYGLARGFLLVVIAYLFYGWLVPAEKQEAWIKNAVSLPVLRSAAATLTEFMPPSIQETLANSALMMTPETPPAPEAAPDDAAPAAQPETGYQQNQTQGLDNLIEGTGGKPQAPASPTPSFGQSPGQ
ncbi:MAG TPA: CvpA family protein [Aestuariivirga sp.]|nr:CvpA family protein [Aestuariivirga sp.]